jgi:plasmid stabilization system protein ParE
MARRFIVRPLAEADLEDAARWYEDERAGLAARFLDDVDRTFARILERPLQFPTVAGDVHRALLHTFPYAVYFRASHEIVTVLAVLHLRRNRKVWRTRVRPQARVPAMFGGCFARIIERIKHRLERFPQFRQLWIQAAQCLDVVSISAAIDAYHKLIDRNPDDNWMDVSEN